MFVEPSGDRRERAGRAIREARQEKGWNQERLADALSAAMQDRTVAGRSQTVGQSTVSRWESGAAAPEPWKLPAIEEVLGMRAAALAEILYDRPERPVVDRAGAIEARLDRVELQLGQLIELLHDLDRRIQGTSPGGDGEA